MDWRELERTVDSIVGGAFSEAVRLSFLKNGTADPARPLVDIEAILLTGGDDSFAPGNGFRARLSAGQGEIVINRSAYTGSMPKTGDRARATDRAGMPWFEVATVSDRYSNLLVLSLNQV